MTAVTPALHLIVLAGGDGLRARRDADEAPKQFQVVGGRPLWLWSVEALGAHPAVASLTLTCAAERCDEVRAAVPAALEGRPLVLAAPGPTRTASTLSALEALAAAAAPADDDLVAVHDAARPLAGLPLLDRLIAAAATHGGAVPGVPVADTTVRVGADGRLAYLPRAELRGVQTPQVFRWAPLLAAHRAAGARGETYTDDGGLMPAAGAPPVLVDGDPRNAKITTAADLAGLRARAREAR